MRVKTLCVLRCCNMLGVRFRFGLKISWRVCGRTSTRCRDYVRPARVMSCTAFTPLNHAPFFPTQGPNAGARSSDSDELLLILKRASARREAPLRAARDKTSVHEYIFELSLYDHRHELLD